MRIEVQVTPNCSHAAKAIEQLRRALDSMGLFDADVTSRTIRPHDEAVAADFYGSPSFHRDGRDIFPRHGTPNLECRPYPNSATPVPNFNHLREALQTANPLL
jgi:hypothetical protein